MITMRAEVEGLNKVIELRQLSRLQKWMLRTQKPEVFQIDCENDDIYFWVAKKCSNLKLNEIKQLSQHQLWKIYALVLELTFKK